MLQGGDAFHSRVQMPGAQRLGPDRSVPARAGLPQRAQGISFSSLISNAAVDCSLPNARIA